MEQLLSALYAAGHKSFDLSIERLIAVLRVALTAFCLVALTRAPGLQPELMVQFALILATYGAFGLGVALLPTIGRVRTGWQLPVHIIDIGVVSILMYFIQKLSMTFFILYVFILLCATFRWNWRGALWTTIAILLVQAAFFLGDGNQAIVFVIQNTLLVVIGGVFVFFGISREHSAKRLNQIAAWPSIRMQNYNEIEHHWLDGSLIHIANVFEARRVLVVWEILQEPYNFAICYSDGKCQQDRAVGDIGGGVSAEVEGVSFASEAVDSNEFLTLDGAKHHMAPIVNNTLKTRYRISSVCSAPFSGEFCKGRVFVLDRSDWGVDDLKLAEIVASRLRIELEYYAICIRLEDTAAARERVRLARDLHDGVLQSLTAAGLQLSLVASESGQKVKQKLAAVRKLLLEEQQRIRAFVEGHQPSARQGHFNLYDELKRERKNIARQWGCSVQVAVTPLDATLPLELMSQIELLFAEATANAVQHGNASHVDLVAEWAPDHVKLRIANNGLGLKGLTGTYSQQELSARGVGPQSISKRVADLGGTFSLSSAPEGVELSIELPINEPTVIKADEQAYALN
jgi:signal transduction histidine kinase